ncbi:MAG TPA: discoidin domain-containing protein, partial [Puia sp.]|nr:discoidin domain-containing protein [Puia sp.]
VRWVGNEEGHAGTTCWETFTPEAPDPGKKPSNGYSKYWQATSGTRNGEFWMPAECDVPLRPGWFYHASQDAQVKTPYQLLDLYYQSVGRGAGLDLGLAPNRDGLLDSHDVAALQQFGALLKQIFTVNLAKDATFTASNIRGGNRSLYGPGRLVDGDRYTYWATDDNLTTPQLTITLGKPTVFNVIRLRENIKLGQRIDSFAVDTWENNDWKLIAAGTSIGACRLIRLQQNVTTSKLRLRIVSAPVCIALSDFGLYKEPTHLVPPTITRDKAGMVGITTSGPVGSIHYTLDGSEPTLQSPAYQSPFEQKGDGAVKARSFESADAHSETTTKEFGLSKGEWKIVFPATTAGTTGSPATPPTGARGNYAAAIDENENTVWSTLQRDTATAAAFPQDITIDMGRQQQIKAFTYLPRQDHRLAGTADRYIFYTSADGDSWQKAAEGEFANIRANPLEQLVPLDHPRTARYFKFSILHVVEGNGVTVAEVGVR